MKDIFNEAAARNALFAKRYGMFFDQFCREAYQGLISAVKERTPVDYGVLRSAFESDSTASKRGNVYTISVANTAKSKGSNPAMYASHIEWGYQQKPGMILKMRMERGRLRFVAFLGYSFAYGKGEPTGEAEPDSDGNYVIVTRKRDVKGHHMLKDSIDDLSRTLPVLYAKRYGEFIKSVSWT